MSDNSNIEVYKSVKKIKLKTSEPYGSILQSDLQCYKTFAGENYVDMSCDSHI
jgi:hypothetical protein